MSATIDSTQGLRFPAGAALTAADDLAQRLDQLNAIGASLSAERDINRLLEAILTAAKTITRADGGTLYRVTEEKSLRFEIVRTSSLKYYLGGTTGNPVPFYPIQLYKDGKPNHSMVAAHTALTGKTINIADAYIAEGFDFSGTRAFDAKTGYRSQSFLTVPMRNHEGEAIGVLQLINAQDPRSGQIVPFSSSDQRLAESLASQAAIALTNRMLINQLESLFESFISLINGAIDEKSPYTGGHDKDRYELKIAGLLHDCGKVTTPVHVVDKATKLETIFDRVQLVDTRFEVLKRDAEIDSLKRRIAMDRMEVSEEEGRLRDRLRKLDDDRKFLHACNIGGERMSDEHVEHVKRIAQYRWRDVSGHEAEFLTADEVKNLTIRAGTLTEEERKVINQHIVATIRMLEALPWPKHLTKVPEYAGGHHEPALQEGQDALRVAPDPRAHEGEPPRRSRSVRRLRAAQGVPALRRHVPRQGADRRGRRVAHPGLRALSGPHEELLERSNRRTVLV